MGERAPLSLALENSKLQHAIVVPSSLIVEPNLFRICAAKLWQIMAVQASPHRTTSNHVTDVTTWQYMARDGTWMALCRRRILGLDSSRQAAKLPLCAWHASVLWCDDGMRNMHQCFKSVFHRVFIPIFYEDVRIVEDLVL